MTPEHYARVRELFCAVFEQPVDERGAYLDEHASASERGDVDELLAQHDQLTATFLNQSDLATLAADVDQTQPAWAPEPGERIGPYVVRKVIGEGGFGLVCEAEQKVPVQRTVALKILKTGLDTREVIARFEAERQALAVMEHRFIAKVLDAGATEAGRPYFVMEYVPGEPITDFCRRKELDVEGRLQLFLQVCEAIEHAHQKGIIHRDIKPSNVLVGMQGERQVPKIIDFGIAKATGPTLGPGTTFTAQGQLVGTPAYMSPEQADVGTLDVDTRSDIYSLGSLLYELLVGAPAFGSATLRGKGMLEIRRILCEQEPLKPSTRVTMRGEEGVKQDTRSLHRRLKGDLDWIVLKAMEKDRARRYATTGEFAADIKRHLAFEPVLAGPPSGFYLLSKFTRRHRAGVAAAVLVALVAGMGFWVVTWQRERARTEAMVASAVIQTMNDLFTSTGERSAKESIDRELLELVTGRMTTDNVFGDKPGMRSRVFGMLGYFYSRLDEEELAADHWEHALTLRRGEFGDDHAETLLNMNSLASVYRDLGSAAVGGDRRAALLDKAEALSREAWKLGRISQGETSRITLSAMSALGAVLRDQKEYGEAVTLLERSLDVQRETLGEEHYYTLRTMSELAGLWVETGEPKKALEPMKEVVKVRRKVSGPRRTQTLEAMIQLAEVYAALERFDDAEEYLNNVAEIGVADLGPDHKLTLKSVEDLRHLRESRSEGRAVEATATRGSVPKPRGGQ